MYKTIDLCAGIGGIRKGFEMTGKFKNVLSAEIDLSASKTYKLLFGENPFNDLTSDDFKRKVIETPYDVLLAGFPCQTFSRAGLEKGFDDSEKGVIFWHIAEIIEKTHPKAFFLENVDNLVKHDNGRTFRIIIETLEKKFKYERTFSSIISRRGGFQQIRISWSSSNNCPILGAEGSSFLMASSNQFSHINFPS